MRHDRGFTLIELMVVIAIIGLLSSIVLSGLEQGRAKGRDARRLSDLNQVVKALELYATENNGSYPPSSSLPLAACGGAPNCLASLATGSPPPLQKYLATIPSDPRFANTLNNYQYCAVNPARKEYSIAVRLEKNSNFCLLQTGANVSSGSGCWTTNGNPNSPYTWCK